MSEIYIEFHHIPPENDSKVRAVLRKHDFDVNDTEDLYGDQLQNYQAGKYESEDLAGKLDKLDCAFQLTYRSEYDGAIYIDPELGRYEEEHGEGGDVVTSTDILYEIYKLDSVEEIRALIDKRTGAAWTLKFIAYAEARAAQKEG